MFRFSKSSKELCCQRLFYSLYTVKHTSTFTTLSKDPNYCLSLRSRDKTSWHVLGRTFRTRTFQQPSVWESSPDPAKLKEKRTVGLSQDDVARVKAVFAEGYLAGRIGSTPTPSKTWKIIVALISGIIMGFFLPLLLLAKIRVNLDKNLEIDGKKVGTKFDDVKGVNEAKQELQDVVEFLRRPLKFSLLGGKLPKGVLLVGPPGTGKTLLARALAGEAGVPYFHMSGSEFEQTFVGEGAHRVRDLFKRAKRNAPCVIFIDEIDSVGSKRIHSPMHPHSNQTLNQLLTEMDGFIKNEGVIVVAATNRREDLDQALLRPGRFDVEIVVSPPDYTGRREILGHYLAKIACDMVNVDELARGTVGFTGADLENMVNRSALRAAMDGAMSVSAKHLNAERDRILMGPENKSRIPDPASNAITAYHEGGHCLVAIYTPHGQPVHKASIVPRGQALGHTAYLPEKEEVYVTKAQLLARIDALLAGRAAEELIFGPNQVTSGAASDLRKATELAGYMVARWGMSDRVGLRTCRPDNDGPATRDLVDQEVQRILHESYERAKTMLKKYSREHTLLAEALLEYETLDAKEIRTIMSHQKLDR